MDKNTSLLESLVLLAILKRQKDRKKNKIENNNTQQDKWLTIENDVSTDKDDKQEILSYDSNDSSKTITNFDNDNTELFKNEGEKSNVITAYCFDNKTGILKKILIPNDNIEFKNVKDLTNSIINKRAVCEICGKTFNEKNLKYHMNKHSNNFPYKCTIDNCKRAYASAQMLRQHQKFHSKIKRYKCEFCDRSFYMPNSLKNHRLLHFDPTIECEKCGKMFYTKNALKLHEEKIHLGIKKYVCSICDKRYINHGSLRKHLILIHNQKFTSQRIAR